MNRLSRSPMTLRQLELDDGVWRRIENLEIHHHHQSGMAESLGTLGKNVLDQQDPPSDQIGRVGPTNTTRPCETDSSGQSLEAAGGMYPVARILVPISCNRRGQNIPVPDHYLKLHPTVT